MSHPGILYVSMQPKPGLSIDQFHEWYNNEHGPTRLRLPDIFGNGLRYRAIDGEKPEYMAVYDVKSMHDLETERYLSLRANRSDREARTIAEVDVVRYFWDLVHTKAVEGYKGPEEISDAEALGRTCVAVTITPTEAEGASEEYQKWYVEEHAEMLSKVPGWLRSRLFVTSKVESGQTKRTYFALHDYAKQNGLGGPEHKASMDTPWRTKVFDKCVASKGRRAFALFYVFGPAPRDLSHLAQLPASADFRPPDRKTHTQPGVMPCIDSYITTPDGLSIPYRLEGNSSDDAPTVALCNSLLTSLDMWDPFVAILKKQRPDLRILRYDHRGRNEIPQPPVAATLSAVTADLVTILDALRIPKLEALIGVSMGGATTLNFALQHPDRLKKFIACDFNTSSSAANTQAWKDRIAVAEGDGGKGIGKLAEQTVSRWFHPSSMEDAQVVEWMTDMVAANNVQGFANGCTVLWDYDLKPQMGSCKVPGLFVVGEGDGKGALVKAMDGFKDKLGEGGAELKIVPNAGHLPMCEEPQGFWEAIKGFL